MIIFDDDDQDKGLAEALRLSKMPDPIGQCMWIPGCSAPAHVMRVKTVQKKLKWKSNPLTDPVCRDRKGGKKCVFSPDHEYAQKKHCKSPICCEFCGDEPPKKYKTVTLGRVPACIAHGGEPSAEWDWHFLVNWPQPEMMTRNHMGIWRWWFFGSHHLLLRPRAGVRIAVVATTLRTTYSLKELGEDRFTSEDAWSRVPHTKVLLQWADSSGNACSTTADIPNALVCKFISEQEVAQYNSGVLLPEDLVCIDDVGKPRLPPVEFDEV